MGHIKPPLTGSPDDPTFAGQASRGAEEILEATLGRLDRWDRGAPFGPSGKR